jgi:hypothetical protein
MAAANMREQYEEAWHELLDLARNRNRLLRSLDTMARVAMDVTPAEGLLIEFDVTRAEDLISLVDMLTPKITAGIQKLNGLAELCGRPTVKWQNVTLRTD